MLLGAGCFVASDLLFQYFVPVADYFDAVPPFLASFTCALIISVVATTLTILTFTKWLRAYNSRMSVALDNMSQGLCMFDSHERLVVYNRRYADMYKLPATVAKAGITLRALLQQRVANGTFARSIDEYRSALLASLTEGHTTQNEVTSNNGRVISVLNRPMVGGGWVATHEDITERRDAERERALMQEQQKRRGAIEEAIAAFRQRVEDHLRTVSEGAMAMRAATTTLFANSAETSKSAESAVTTSNEASANVETAAIAADKLTSSIGEIGRQLDLTTDIVRSAVNEAQGTNQQIAALAQAAKKSAK